MADEQRISQEVVEVTSSVTSLEQRISQEVVEIGSGLTTIDSRMSQMVVEVMSRPYDAGILILKKITSPSLSYSFTVNIDGNIDHYSTPIQDGDTIIYDPIRADTYSVVEVADSLYSTTYIVDNDPSNDNLNVIIAKDETVTVTITNILIASIPGLYKSVPGKTDDYITAIPNPFVETYQIGDD